MLIALEALHEEDLLASAPKVGRRRLIKACPRAEYTKRSAVGAGFGGDFASEGAVDVDEVDGGEDREDKAERPGLKSEFIVKEGVVDVGPEFLGDVAGGVLH
jgi:hypothetical protein